ncbi:hypothetical protein TSAR_006874, partial [Trichomalopsis sarcophagae]
YAPRVLFNSRSRGERQEGDNCYTKATLSKIKLKYHLKKKKEVLMSCKHPWRIPYGSTLYKENRNNRCYGNTRERRSIGKLNRQ